MVLGALVDAGCQLGDARGRAGEPRGRGLERRGQAVERGGLRGTHLVVAHGSGAPVPTPRRHAPAHRALEPAGAGQGARGVRAPAAGRGRGARASGPGRRGALPRGRRPRHARRRRGGGGRPRCPRRRTGCTSRRCRSAAAPCRPPTDGSRFPRRRPPSCCEGFPSTTTGSPRSWSRRPGAAILTTLGTPARLPAMTLERIGWGAGTRELPVPESPARARGRDRPRGRGARRRGDAGEPWRRRSTTCRPSSTSRFSSGSWPRARSTSISPP